MRRQGRKGNTTSWYNQVRAYLSDLDGRAVVNQITLGYAAKPIEAEDERITVEDGDGVAGNPTIGLGNWPSKKNSVEADEEPIVRDGHQLIVFDDFVFNGGNVIIDGELVVLGDDDTDWPLVKDNIPAPETVYVPLGFQLLVAEAFDVQGTLDLEGTLVIL